MEVTNAVFLNTYFPPELFSGREGEFMVRWYSKTLYALDDKPLWPGVTAEPIYRFTWSRSFSYPLSVSLTLLPDGTGIVVLHAADAELQHLTANQSRSIGAEQVAEFLELLEHAEFWQMPSLGGRRGFDGSEWILEGTRNGNYHLVTRWCAGETAFGAAAFRLVELSGFPVNGQEILMRD